MQDSDVFDDLSPYSRMISPYTLPAVLNMGWLDVKSDDYPTGVFSVAALQKLKDIAGGRYKIKALVEPLRTAPRCEICGELKMSYGGKLLPDAELWIPAAELIYASPLAIIHFIEVHRYCPPAVYAESVLGVDPDLVFDADATYRAKLKESGWFATQFKPV